MFYSPQNILINLILWTKNIHRTTTIEGSSFLNANFGQINLMEMSPTTYFPMVASSIKSTYVTEVVFSPYL